MRGEHVSRADSDSQGNRSRSEARSATAQKRPILRFVILVGVLLAVYYVCTTTSFFQKKVFPAYLRFNAVLAARVLDVVGQETVANGDEIVSPRFSVQIRRGCDALEPTALFVAGVLAFPVSWRARILGAAGGALLLAVLNCIRILTLFLTGVYWRSAFDVMHADFWQSLFIVFTIALWTLWAFWATRPPGRPAHATA